MPKRKTKKWTAAEVQKIKDYAREHAVSLRTNMYKNIFVGRVRFPKQRGFFQQLHRLIGRTATKCKSKFQKMEREIYVGELKVPPETFNLFLWTRFRTRLEAEQRRFLRRAIAKKRTRNLRKKRSDRDQVVPGKLVVPESRRFARSSWKSLVEFKLHLIRKCLDGDLDFPELTAGTPLI